jgi:hypothetical protein
MDLLKFNKYQKQTTERIVKMKEIEMLVQIGENVSDFSLKTTIYILVQKLGGDVAFDFNDFKKALTEAKTLRVFPDDKTDGVRLKLVNDKGE